MESWPRIGCGAGLRTSHYSDIINQCPKLDWFEALSENYMDSGGKPLRTLEKVRTNYPIALHGTSLSIGSTDPLNKEYLTRLKRLIHHVDPFIVSDHLCWSGTNGERLHDLLPLPFTEEAVAHVVQRARQVQDFLGRRILLENVSSYVTYKHSAMPEWEFISEIAKRSGCGILFDANNIFVNSVNHKFDPYEYVRNIPGDLVGQIHLAGHTDMGDFLFDTHSAPIIDEVWDLYREALKLWGPVSTLVEWDEDIPPFKVLLSEVEKAKVIYKNSNGARFPRPPEKQRDQRPNDCGIRWPSSELPQDGRARQSNPSFLEQIERSMRNRVSPLAETKNEMPLEKLLNPQAGTPGEERMAVYAHGYLARVREALSEVFETVEGVLGAEAFTHLSIAYAKRHPSHDYNLNYVGMHLPRFLKTKNSWNKEKPFLSDLAMLEWAIWKAFHAFHGSILKRSEMEQVSAAVWESAIFKFQPSVKIVTSDWPIFDIWRSQKSGTVPGNPFLFKNLQKGRPQTNPILVSRAEDQVLCEPMDSVAAELLTNLLSGKSLGDACSLISGGDDGKAPPVTAWFSKWVQGGLIATIRFSETASKEEA
jgi:uncharacterized protein